MWPPLVRHLFLPAHETLLLRPTLSIARRLARDDGWTAAAVARYQADGRERLVRHALAATAYWRGRAQRERLAPTGIDFPLLTRDEVARHREAMRWPEAPGRLIRDTSSGTTDDSLVFYVDRPRQAWDRALRLHALARLGIEPGERQLHIWPEYTGGSFGRLKALLRATRDRFTNDPVFDLRPMTPERLDAALAFLDRWRPAVVLGYPSWLHALAQRRLRHGRGGWTPRRVVTTAELLYDFQRRAIESAFGAPVAEEYGSQGVGLIASEDGDRRWRLHWQQVQVELLDASGRPARPGEIGQIVVTNLHSQAMPFIRFATGDVARAPSGDDAAIPGTPATLPRIAGRTADLVVAADGRLQDNRQLIDAVVRETGATEFALHQPAPERLVVLAADRAGGAVLARGPVTELLRSMLGRSLRVDWRVGAFLPAASGKRRYVCSPVGQALLAHDGEAAVERSRGWPQRVFTCA